ncbi:uncharacterized protein [Primulina huaijiensis]|uniref:uncharacterized protein isoform X2 n=1 Tax=Primulina huaijiensis TaxID=1492673 RepID=UPI003CC743F2
MVEGVKKIEKKSVENMKDDDELERLLGEIPHATSLNLHPAVSNVHSHHNNLVHNGYGHASCVIQNMNGRVMYDDEFFKHKYTCASSPVSGFSLQSDGSSSSLFSGGLSLSDIGSPTPPQFEELKPHLIPGNGYWLDCMKANDGNFIDDLNLSKNFGRMCISGEQEGVLASSNGFQSSDPSVNVAIMMNLDKLREYDIYRKGFSDCGGFNLNNPCRPLNFQGQLGSAVLEMQRDHRIANVLKPRHFSSRSDEVFAHSEFVNSAPSPQFYRTNMLTSDNLPIRFGVSDVSSASNKSLVGDNLFYASQNEMNLIEPRNALFPHAVNQLGRLMSQSNGENLRHYQPSAPTERSKVPSCVRVPQGSDAFTMEDRLMIQGEECMNYEMNRGQACSRGHGAKDIHQENRAGMTQEKRPHFDARLRTAAAQDSCQSPKLFYPFPLPLKFSSLAEAQGYIYHIAKDQHGCRFLQKIFDEGTSRDVQIIYSEIIDHVVELMMNPFGNYLMQKLLGVCNEEQRMNILLRVTEMPGELVQISLNTHGTRVVQKLIETLKTRHQISLVISALEPGFLALIKDLNGNHVVQRCLQCFTNEDSKFIFAAAAKYCVNIAMHQHGCCVLQRCIRHSNGEQRENLVAEISANGLLLAQDAFGNYAVQFILELKIPSATSKLTSQFENNYVHLSTQKFSSHVVEKCLDLCNVETQSKIIHELLSADYFEQLLQDPHANYVVQKALHVSEGPLHNLLVDAIESHKAISRNSPYSKRIFSHKLLRR